MDLSNAQKARRYPKLAVGLTLASATFTRRPAYGAMDTFPPTADEAANPSRTLDEVFPKVELPSGDAKWTTSDQSRVVRLLDGTTITIAPHSEVTRRSMAQVDLGLKDTSP